MIPALDVPDLPLRTVADVPTRMPLDPLDIAAGWPSGEDPEAQPLPEVPPDLSPRRALEEPVLPALRRAPCLVAFSGGRDSSLVLAVATHVARREGLPDPVPATHRHPDVPATDEDDWQELVVRHLGLDDWIRMEVHDELELLGPVATAAMRRHGLLWPANVHAHVPIMREARGGSVLTGVDGDGLLGGWRWRRVSDLLVAGARPTPRDVLRVGLALAPSSVRRRVERRRLGADWPWLRPHPRRTVRDRTIHERADDPRRWDERVRRFARERYHRVFRDSYRLLADDAGVEAVHPLLDPAFLAALARDGSRWGIGDRTSAMRRLADDLLPPAIVQRDSKAEFTGAFVRAATRRFVSSLEPRDVVAPELVDPDVVLGTWKDPGPDARTASLLQATWLRRELGGEEPA